ncbi:MAG: alginate lyase family protein [Anaeroplasmataceae bacterium]|nr:alginate lyase family protein [Anaeroplasmataceae bacterium]
MTFDEFMKEPVNSLYAFSEAELREIKRKISNKNLEKIVKMAEEAMEIPYQSVTYKKKGILVKDKHDYESFSIYSWPNPDTKDGLPYIKKDGNQNPRHLEGDKLALRKMAYAVYYLGLLYYITKDKKYYLPLRNHLYCFFIHPETKMNPNLNHGQAMPGVNEGQRGGIIDFGVTFGYALAILQGLRAERLLDYELCLNLGTWLRQFQLWLLESPFGKEMNECKNNHSLVYDYLLLIISTFLDDYYMMVFIKSRYTERMKQQILENGDMPLETKRVNSRSYYFMNLKLFIEIGKILCMDLKNYPLLMTSVHYYGSHCSKEAWEYPQHTPFTEEYDNYFYYNAKKYFGLKNFELKKSKKLQYVLLADVYGGGNET